MGRRVLQLTGACIPGAAGGKCAANGAETEGKTRPPVAQKGPGRGGEGASRKAEPPGGRSKHGAGIKAAGEPAGAGGGRGKRARVGGGEGGGGAAEGADAAAAAAAAAVDEALSKEVDALMEQMRGAATGVFSTSFSMRPRRMVE